MVVTCTNPVVETLMKKRDGEEGKRKQKSCRCGYFGIACVWIITEILPYIDVILCSFHKMGLSHNYSHLPNELIQRNGGMRIINNVTNYYFSMYYTIKDARTRWQSCNFPSFHSFLFHSRSFHSILFS